MPWCRARLGMPSSLRKANVDRVCLSVRSSIPMRSVAAAPAPMRHSSGSSMQHAAWVVCRANSISRFACGCLAAGHGGVRPCDGR